MALTADDLPRTLARVDAFNAVRCRRDTIVDRTATPAHLMLAEYVHRRDTDGDVDYPLLLRALEGFGTEVLLPYVLTALEATGLEELRLADIGCGTGWLSFEIAARTELPVTSLLLVDRSVDQVRVGYDPFPTTLPLDLENPGHLVRGLLGVLRYTRSNVALLSEVLHCLQPTQARNLLRALDGVPHVLVVEQVDDGTEVAERLRQDLGPTNHLYTEEQLSTLLRETGLRLDGYAHLRQYWISVWGRD